MSMSPNCSRRRVTSAVTPGHRAEARRAPPASPPLCCPHELEPRPEPRLPERGSCAHILLRPSQRFGLARSICVVEPMCIEPLHQQGGRFVTDVPQADEYASRPLCEEGALQSDRTFG